MTAGALGALKTRSRSTSRRPSRTATEEKNSEIQKLELDKREDEESQKLKKELESLMGTLGVQDPMQVGSSLSRRGSRVVGKYILSTYFFLGRARSVCYSR